MDNIHHVLPEGEGTATSSIVDAGELAPHVEFTSNEVRGQVRRLDKEIFDVADLVGTGEIVIAKGAAKIWARVMVLGVDARNQILAEVALKKTDEEIMDRTTTAHALARTCEEICHSLIVVDVATALRNAVELQDDELVDVLPELKELDLRRYEAIIRGLPLGRVADLALSMPEVLHSASLTTLPVDLAVDMLELAACGDSGLPAMIGDLIAQDHPQAIQIFAGLKPSTAQRLLNAGVEPEAQVAQDEASATLGHWLGMHRVEIEAARKDVKAHLRQAKAERAQEAKKALHEPGANLGRAPDIDVTDDVQ